MELDATDLRLLDLLQTDASLSNQDLAERALTSPATALRRVRRMVDSGLIERRVALLDTQRLGAGLTALVEISLDRQGAEHLDAFEQRAVADGAVQQCWRVSPGPDFVLVLQVRDSFIHLGSRNQIIGVDARRGLHPAIGADRGQQAESILGSALEHMAGLVVSPVYPDLHRGLGIGMGRSHVHTPFDPVPHHQADADLGAPVLARGPG